MRGLLLSALGFQLSATPFLALGQQPPALGQQPSAESRAPRAENPIGTIVIAHGGDSLWNSHVLEAARRAQTGGPVEVSFLMGPAAKTSRFQDAVARLEKAGVREIVVVPMLVSSHSGHYDQIRYLAGDSVKLDHAMEHHLHMSGIERPKTNVKMRLASALDAAPPMASILTDRALALAPKPAGRALLIVGHGPNSAEDYAAWMSNLRVVADSVKARSGFRDVRVELVRDDAPAAVRAEAVLRTRELIDMQRMITGQDVIVVPVLISKGTVSRDKLPRDLAGMPIVYSGEPLLPHPGIVRWIESSVRASAATTN
jgi:sirohydrochlorin cobaltochelatase